MTHLSSHQISQQSPQSIHPMRLLAGSCIGNIVEWYNFMVYAYLIPQISTLFFPHQGLASTSIFAFLIFAAGFLARPLGAIFFGWMGDRFGRRWALIISQVMMILATTLFACMPTYATWGSTATLTLVFLRILQGFSIGGEYTASLCYIVEVVNPRRSRVWSSIISSSTALGILLSAWVVFAAVHLLPASALLAWGWRACFGVGVLLAILGVYLRAYLPETPVFLKNQKEGTLGQWRDFLNSQVIIRILKVFLIGALYAYCYQLFFVWVPNTFTHGAFQQDQLLMLTGISMVIFMACIILGGLWSDRYGEAHIMTISLGILLLLWWPLSKAGFASSAAGLSLFLLVNSIIFGVFVGAASGFFASLFPSQIRASALSMSYNSIYAVVGGLTPVILAFTMHTHGLEAVRALSMTLIAIALVVAWVTSLSEKSQIPK